MEEMEQRLAKLFDEKLTSMAENMEVLMEVKQNIADLDCNFSDQVACIDQFKPRWIWPCHRWDKYSKSRFRLLEHSR